jgi:hypothetical protein
VNWKRIATPAALVLLPAAIWIGEGARLATPGFAGPSPQPAFAAAPGSPLMVGPMAGRPAVGDVNGDKAPDIVVACGTCCGSRPDPKSGHIVVLLGDGKGEFTDADGSPIKVASSVRKVALGDLNRDGKLDVVAAEHDTYNVTVLLGDGSGRFKAAPGSPIAASKGGRPHTHDIALGDANGDGKLDLLTTNANDNTLSLLLGDGAGRFAPAPNSPIAAGRHPYDALAARDLNGDGKLDVAVPNLMGNAISVLLGDGRGALAPAPDSPISVGERPGYVAVADVNNDGRPDLCATHDDVGLVDVLLGDGSGRFKPAPTSPVRLAAPVWGLAAADLDGDGAVDLALGAMGENEPIVLLGDGKGGFAQAEGLSLGGGNSPNYAVAADLNGDGRPDIVTGNYGSGDVSVFLGRPGANTQAGPRAPVTAQPRK